MKKIQGKEFEDSGWLVKTRYDIISNSYAASVPNVNSTSDCHDICEIVDRYDILEIFFFIC